MSNIDTTIHDGVQQRMLMKERQDLELHRKASEVLEKLSARLDGLEAAITAIQDKAKDGERILHKTLIEYVLSLPPNHPARPEYFRLFTMAKGRMRQKPSAIMAELGLIDPSEVRR